MIFLSKGVIFRFHVNFLGGIFFVWQVWLLVDLTFILSPENERNITTSFPGSIFPNGKKRGSFSKHFLFWGHALVSGVNINMSCSKLGFAAETEVMK